MACLDPLLGCDAVQTDTAKPSCQNTADNLENPKIEDKQVVIKAFNQPDNRLLLCLTVSEQLANDGHSLGPFEHRAAPKRGKEE